MTMWDNYDSDDDYGDTRSRKKLVAFRSNTIPANFVMV